MGQVPYCPVFRPTKEEFKDFQIYLEKCVKQAGNAAIFKVSFGFRELMSAFLRAVKVQNTLNSDGF